MRLFKNLLVSLFAVILLVAPAYADIVEEINQLSPEQFEALIETIEEKYAAAEMKDNTASIFIQRITPTKFNDAFSHIRTIDALYGFDFAEKEHIGHNVYVGGKSSFAFTYATRDTAPQVYEDVFLGYGALQALLEYRIVQNDIVVLSANAGGGFLVGGHNYSKTDENTQTDFETYRIGANWCASAGLDASVVIEDGWGIGLGVGYFKGKIDSSQRLFHSKDDNAPEMDLSGVTAKLSVSKFF